MISFTRFFEDRPRIVAWAVIILAIDAAWGPVEEIITGGFVLFSFIINIFFPLYLIHKIAEGKPGSRINYVYFFGFTFLLGFVWLTSLAPELDSVMRYLHPRDTLASRFGLRVIGLMIALSPKLAAYYLLYTKEADIWFKAGGGKPEK